MYTRHNNKPGGFKVGDLERQKNIQQQCLILHDAIESAFHEMRTAPYWSDRLLERVQSDLLNAVSLISLEHSEKERDSALASEQARSR